MANVIHILPLYLIMVGSGHEPAFGVLDLFPGDHTTLSPAEITTQITKLLNVKLTAKALSKKQLYNLLLRRGDAYVILNKIEDAKKDFAALKKMFPKDPEILYREGIVLLYEKNPKGALLKAERMLTEFPEHYKSLSLAALCWRSLGKTELMIDYCTKGIGRNKDYYLFYLVRSQAHFLLGNLKESVKDLDEYIRLQPAGLSNGPAWVGCSRSSIVN